MAGTIISIVGTAISALSFLQSNFPGPDSDGGTTLRFAIGIDGSRAPDGTGARLGNAGGSIPDILLFDELGNNLGNNFDPGSAPSGDANATFRVKQPDYPGSQASYALLVGNDDAVCMAYISETWADGTKWAWTGDWAQNCSGNAQGRQTWYYSNIIINGDEPHKPRCSWIDKNGDAGPMTGVQIHFPDFTKNKSGQYNRQKSYYCNSPSLQWYYNSPDSHTIYYYDPPRNYDSYNVNSRKHKRDFEIERRETIKQSEPVRIPEKPSTRPYRVTGPGKFLSIDPRLVISSDPQHGARDLCEADRSSGPDFVSLSESLFCDMHTKSILPLCDGKSIFNCFDMDKLGQVINGLLTFPTKYIDVITWD